MEGFYAVYIIFTTPVWYIWVTHNCKSEIFHNSWFSIFTSLFMVVHTCLIPSIFPGNRLPSRRQEGRKNTNTINQWRVSVPALWWTCQIPLWNPLTWHQYLSSFRSHLHAHSVLGSWYHELFFVKLCHSMAAYDKIYASVLKNNPNYEAVWYPYYHHQIMRDI